MAALNCMSTFHHPSTTFSHIDSRPRPMDGASISSGFSSTRQTFKQKGGRGGSSFRRLKGSAYGTGQQQGGGDSGAVSYGDSAPSSSVPSVVQAPGTATDIVLEFYERINQRDYVGVTNLFTEDCEYEDFNYSDTTRGREAVLKFFEKVMSSIGTELKFVIDDMTRDDPNAVGVIWHLDWRGKAFPFSRGCSFYRCVVNSAGERQIRFARDIVEPATKPGAVALGAIRLVTSLFERFPQLVDRL